MTVFRGFVTADPRCVAENVVGTGYTQQGRRPGRPVPSGTYEATLLASGDQGDYDVEVACQRGGMIETDGATMRWRKTTDNNDEWRGMEVWKNLVGVQRVESTSLTTYTFPDAITLPDGAVVAVAYREGVGTGVVSFRREAAGTSWTQTGVALGALATSTPRHACICSREFDDKDVMPELYAFYLSDAEAGFITIASARSSDGGVTWETLTESCLSTTLDTTVYDFNEARLRCAYANGQILVLLEVRWDAAPGLYESVVIQFASSDYGHTLEQISVWDGYSWRAGRYFDILADEEKFLVFYIDPYIDASGDPAPALKIIGDAYDDLGLVEPSAIMPSDMITWGIYSFATLVASGAQYYLTDGDMSACKLDDGQILVYTREDGSSQHIGFVLRSKDHGETWDHVGQETLAKSLWWRCDSATGHPERFKTVTQAGRVLMLANCDASAASGADDELFALAFGGWSQQTMPAAIDRTFWRYRAGYRFTWFGGFAEPQDVSPDVVAGAGSESVRDDYIDMATFVGQTRDYTWNNAYAAGGVWIAKRSDGGSTTAPEIGIQLQSDNGSSEWIAQICIAANTVRVRDAVSGTEIAQFTLSTAEPLLQIFAVIDESNLYVTVGEVEQLDEDREFPHRFLTSSLTSRPTSGTGNEIRWGHVAAATTTADSRWYMRGYINVDGFDSLTEGWTNPDNLQGGPLGDRIWLKDGLTVSAYGGPLFGEDTWTLPRTWDYGIVNVFADQPVDAAWRSESDIVPESIEIEFAGGLPADGYNLNESFALAIFGANWRTATFSGLDQATSTWVSLATIDMSTDLGPLAWRLAGGVVVPDIGASNPTRWIHHGELRGATFEFGTVTGDLSRITRNTGGVWNDSVKHPALWFDVPYAASGTGISGRIWARNIVVVIHDNAARYQRFRLSIPAQTTVDGYFEIGTMILGPLHAVAWGMSAETVVDVQPRVERTEYPNGIIKTVRRGMTRRVFGVSWADPVDTTEIYRDAEPTSINNFANGPVAAYSADASLVTGLLGDEDFITKRIVYIRRCESDAGTYQTTDPEEFALVQVTSGQEWSGVLGNEAENQVVTGGELQLTEEVGEWKE